MCTVNYGFTNLIFHGTIFFVILSLRKRKRVLCCFAIPGFGPHILTPNGRPSVPQFLRWVLHITISKGEPHTAMPKCSPSTTISKHGYYVLVPKGGPQL